MTEYLGRREWTSTDASGTPLGGGDLRGVAFHWPGTAQDVVGPEPEGDTAARLRGYRSFHVGGRGWRDIGYNLAVDQSGRVWMLRSTSFAGDMVGAHCASSSNPDANREYVGVLLIVGDREAPSAAMLAAVSDWYWTRFLPAWPGRDDTRGHGRVPGAQTSCQGPHVRAALADGSIPGPREQEDDMPSPKDWDSADWEAFAGKVRGAISHGGIVDVGADRPWSVAHALGNAAENAGKLLHGQIVRAPEGVPERTLPHAVSLNLRRVQELAAVLAQVIAGQRAIMAAAGAEVDEGAVAAQVAAVVTPAVVAELGEQAGASPDEVEARAAAAVRRVLGGLDAA